MEKSLTIRHILNKINIHISTYLIMLLSFLAGYFEVVFLTMFSIIIHELGHFITAYLLGLRVSEIRIFMFGGVTVLDESLSVDIKKEVLTLLMGPISQISFVVLVYVIYINGYVGVRTWELFLDVNLLLLGFNLLPILPLDGGRLLNNILDLVFPYGLSHLISVCVSFLFIPFLFVYGYKFFVSFLVVFLIVKNVEETIFHRFRVFKLITERKLSYHKFRRCSKIRDLKGIYRNRNFVIEVNDMLLRERDFFKYESVLEV